MICSLELFSGTGGLAIGLHQAGFEPVALLKKDKHCCDNLKSNIRNSANRILDWNILQMDVRYADYSEFGSGIQFVTGGPPCQPFSLGSKHQSFSDFSDMFPEAVQAVWELSPQGFIFENVKGLTRKSFSLYFR